jgi:aminocarboxymuconate-semialdehyde decarboxylase
MLEQRRAAAQPAARRQVSVGGQRVKTIDFHAHVWFPEAAALVGAKVTPPSLQMADARLRAMDAQGIDVEAISINRYHYDADRDTAA